MVDTRGRIPLVRPGILRRTAYFSRMVLFFVIILSVPVLQVYLTAANPNLRIDFQPSKDQGNRNRKPDGVLPTSISGESNGIHARSWRAKGSRRRHAFDSFRCSADCVLELGRHDIYDLGSTDRYIPRSPKFSVISFPRVFLGIYFFASVATHMTFPQLDQRTTLFEYGFFFFVHHRLLVATLTLAAFFSAQWIALRRIQRFLKCFKDKPSLVAQSFTSFPNSIWERTSVRNRPLSAASQRDA